MKFIKSTVAIAALFVIGSANAKMMVTEASIDTYITDLLNNNYTALENAVITNYNEQNACQIISDLGQTISNKYPNNATAKRLFTTQMNTLFSNMTNNNNRATMQNCADRAMTVSNRMTTPPTKTRNTQQTRCRGGRCNLR
jgi:hypothetical protein